MKSLAMAVCLMLLFFAVPLQAQTPDPLIGTWVLNVAKSAFKTGPQFKSSTREFAVVPNGLKYSGQNVNADGTASGSRWTAYFDGKDYPVTGDPISDTISLKRVDRFNTEGTFKKGGKVTGHVTRVVSHDGKVWTLTVESIDALGRPYSSVLVFDKK